MLLTPILLGVDLDVIIKIAIVLLFVVGPAILKMFGGSTTQSDSGRNRETPRPPRTPQKPRPQQGGGNDLESEISDFLQRANRDQRGESAPPTYASEHEMVEAEIVTPLPALTAHDQLPSHLADTPQEALPSHGEDYTDEVETYLQAAREPAREPEAFDYDLGDMEEEEGKRQSATAAAELAAMFRNPSDMRKVIILNEIMNRPVRW
ncbi:hypothetical protein M4951_01080 [Blastopirellula sp. J2-11]|uniref:hypothetical protein n=1 Tax=Blastopirellula sp. J2-11 TaxID=2943192 RepID=UPI0021C7EEFD|nr:hypothetical protein [Blastopirellula sp. J2-11]UUO06920.1 hypothetical protein M4951_01080 [Blastopirellula sp. J2-11]